MNTQLKTSQQSGFTLIEILIVIGVIAILAAIVLVAVNPAQQFKKANDAQRSSNVNAILNAVGQHIVDNKGVSTALGNEIPVGDEDDAVEIGSGSGEADLCALLTPTYIAGLPVDPGLGTPQSIPAIGDDCTDSYSTGYEIYRNAEGRITVTAPDTQIGAAISVTR